MNRELLERILRVLKGECGPGAYIIPLISELENELEKPDFNDEFNNMVDKGTQAWKDVKNATDFVDQIRGDAGVIQEPLSNDQIWQIASDHFPPGQSLNHRRFARAIEKAHGIGYL